MYNHECFEARTNVSYPTHEFISGRCTRCGEADPALSDDAQDALEDLWNETLADGGYVREGVPVPYSSTVYNSEGSPVVRKMSHGYESA